MTAFARQLRGRAELVRNAAGGVTARLIFPTPAAERAPQPAAPGEPGRSLSVARPASSTLRENHHA